MKRVKNPFLYGRPVPIRYFVGRNEQIHTVLNRLDNSESSLLVGEPHIGKSSLIRFLCDSSQHAKLGWHERWIPVEMECHLLPSHWGVKDFWRSVLLRTAQKLPENSLRDQVRIRAEEHFDPLAILDLATRLGREGWKIVLILDELDSIFGLPALCHRDFFGPVRSLSTNTEGIAVLAASRTPLSVLNERTSNFNGGSPFMNNHTDVRLAALTAGEVDQLIDLALLGTSIDFSPQVRVFIERVAGRHPYLVQALGAALFDAITRGREAEDLYMVAMENFRLQTDAHFAATWASLGPEAQIATTVLALVEAQGKTYGREFSTKDIVELDRFAPELEELQRRGLVELVGPDVRWRWDAGSYAIWKGRRWGISAEAFTWWLLTNAVTSTRDRLDFREWLRLREKEGILNKGEIAAIQKLSQSLPSNILETAKFVRGLFGLQ